MSFNSGDLITSPIARVRLLIGDIDDWAILEDSVYEYLLIQNNYDELKTGIEALENILNYYSLNPADETFGQIEGEGINIRALERRLLELKAKKFEDSSGSKRVPIMLRSGRKDWDDFNKLFGGND